MYDELKINKTLFVLQNNVQKHQLRELIKKYNLELKQLNITNK